MKFDGNATAFASCCQHQGNCLPYFERSLTAGGPRPGQPKDPLLVLAAVGRRSQTEEAGLRLRPSRLHEWVKQIASVVDACDLDCGRCDDVGDGDHCRRHHGGLLDSLVV